MLCNNLLEKPAPSGIVNLAVRKKMANGAMTNHRQVWLRLCVLCWDEIAVARQRGLKEIPAEEHQ